MKQFVGWPPPNWTEVVVTWKTMLDKDTHNPNLIQEWVNTHPGGRFHLHGWQMTEGFAYRFENPEDALIFALRWGE